MEEVSQVKILQKHQLASDTANKKKLKADDEPLWWMLKQWSNFGVVFTSGRRDMGLDPAQA